MLKVSLSSRELYEVKPPKPFCMWMLFHYISNGINLFPRFAPFMGIFAFERHVLDD